VKKPTNPLLTYEVFAAALLTVTPALPAQDARFFRIAGPAATTITEFRPDGTLVWSNALAGTNYTVQTVAGLPGGTNWVDYVQLPVTNNVNTNRLFDPQPPTLMALIPAGSITMGDTLGDWPPEWGTNPEIPTHTVYVSAFYMDRNEVTKALWDSVYAWAIGHGYSFDYAGSGKAANHPVQTIDWYDCVKWCNARSEMEGRTPAYYTSAAQTTVYRTGQLAVDNSWVKWTAGYRLPTEAEWEKAARGGISGQRFPWGNTISWSQANYIAYPSGYAYDTSPTDGHHPAFATGDAPYTSPAGYFAPNGYGLNDMAGNVWEWCWDWYVSYASGSQSDPRGHTSGSYRVGRGGSWDNFSNGCRTAIRLNYWPDEIYSCIGFRSVLPPGQ
jgi:formylglycine-generating enzyme